MNIDIKYHFPLVPAGDLFKDWGWISKSMYTQIPQIGLSSSSVPHPQIQPTLDNVLSSWAAWILDMQDELYIFGKKKEL